MSDARWKVGTITVPSSTGSMAITGLDGTPNALFFWGTNWLTEDAKVASAGHGMFRGMAAPQFDDLGTIVQNGSCLIPTGDAFTELPYAIAQLDTSGTLVDLYTAEVTSFDSDGFTLDWINAASGGYKVVYAALFNVDNVGGYAGANATLSLGWKAGASLLHTAWGGPVGFNGVSTQQSYGGAAYPGSSGAALWQGAGMTCNTFPTSNSQQYDIGLDVNSPSTIIAGSVTFSGPFLQSQNIVCYPSGTSEHDLVFDTNLSDNGGMVVAWDDEDSMTGQLTVPAATGNQTTVSGLSFPPGLVIGYTISDEPDGQGTGGRGAAGFSVITDEFQWCCVSDNGQAYQSFQRGICDVVDSAGVHTATVELITDGFIVTTDDDDVSPNTWAWHAFGHPDDQFVPQFYRVLPGGMTRQIIVPFNFIPEIYAVTINAPQAGLVFVPFIGFLLLENGDQIILEEGTGFLLL